MGNEVFCVLGIPSYLFEARHAQAMAALGLDWFAQRRQTHRTLVFVLERRLELGIVTSHNGSKTISEL